MYKSIFKINQKSHPSFLSTHQAQQVLSMGKCIRKNPNLTSDKNKVKLEYTSEGQSSLLELSFEIELSLNSHFKNLRPENIMQVREQPTRRSLIKKHLMFRRTQETENSPFGAPFHDPEFDPLLTFRGGIARMVSRLDAGK